MFDNVSDQQLLHAIKRGTWITLRHVFDEHVAWDRRFALITQEVRGRNLISWG
jgi:hypothetical protein